MESGARRTKPLSVRIGSINLILVAADVNLLIEAAGRLAEGMRQTHEREGPATTAESLRLHLAELESLREVLANAAGSPADPPLAITRERARLLRQVMADVTGYQRGELTVSLRELRQILTDAYS
jgi:hypothetical protein